MKLHLPKPLFTALLAAITLATPATLTLGSTAWGAEVFDSITRGGNFYAGSYSFSFVLDDAATNGSVVAAFWGDGYGTAALGSNAFTVEVQNDGTYKLYVGRGKLNNTDINASTTFNKTVTDASGAEFTTTLQAGVLYTITGGSTGGAGNATATIDSAYMQAETCGGYNGNMYGTTLSSGVNSVYAVSGGSNAVVWKATSDGASATDTTNWQTITNEAPAAIGDTSILVFEAVNNLSKSVNVTGLNAVRSIKVYDNYTFNATAATTLTTTSGLTIASGKTLTLEDNVTLSIASTIRGACTLALEGGILHVADYTALDDLACTFSEDTDGFRTGFSATLTEGTISTSADAFNITIEGGELTSYENGRLTATLNKEDIFYINTSRNYSAIKTSAPGATGITVSSTGTLSIASSDTDWFVEGTFAAAVPVSNAGNVVLDCSVAEGDPKSGSLNSLFGDSAISQTRSGITTISDANAVSTSANLSTSGTVKISNAASFANNEKTLTLDKLVLENVTEAIINGSDSSSGKVSGTIEVLGKSKLILTGHQDLLGWSDGDYTDKILLRGTDAENKATLQLNTRQTCSTAIVMEGYSSILNGGNAAGSNAADNNAGTLQMHNGGSITATGTNNTFSAILYTNKATTIAVTGAGDKLLIDGVVRGGSAITKTGDGTLTFSGDMSRQSGTINVNDGIVVIDDAATLGSSAYVVASGAELQVSGVTRETFSNAVSGAGTLTKTGAGTLTLSGTLGASEAALGSITVNGGNLEILNTSYVTSVNLTGGNLTYGGTDVTHTISEGVTSSDGSQNSTFAVASGSTVNLASLDNAWGVNLDIDGTMTISGAVTGSGKLVKDGAGTLKLSGANTYTGGIAVSGGTLAITTANALGGGSVSLADGTILDATAVQMSDNFKTIVNKTSGEGLVKFTGGDFADSQSDATFGRVSVRENVVVAADIQVDGDLAINSWSQSGAVVNTTVNKALTVNGDFRVESQATLVLDQADSAVSADTITLGHADGSNAGHIALHAGSLTTGAVSLTDGTNTASTLTMTGGELTINQEDGTIAAGAQVKISGGTLKAADASWTLNLDAADSIGNVTFNLAAEKSITLGGSLSITGALSISGEGTLKFAEGAALNLTSAVMRNLDVVATNITGNGLVSNASYALVKGSYTGTPTVSVGGVSHSFSNGQISSTDSLFLITSTFSTSDATTANGAATADRFHVNAGGIFTLAGDISYTTTPEEGETATTATRTVADLLSTTTGTGTIVLSTNATLANNTTLSFRGTLEIGANKTFTIGTTGGGSDIVNISSLSNIIIGSGAHFDYHANPTQDADIQKLTVTSGTGEFWFHDSAGSALSIGEINVSKGATLKMTSRWFDSATTVGRLIGAGILDVYSPSNSSTGNVTIQSLAGFSGDMSFTKSSGNGLNVTVNTGTTAVDFGILNVLRAEGQNTDVNFTLNVQADTTVDMLNAAVGTVNLAHGTTLTLGQTGEGAQATTSSIGTLTGGADSTLNLAQHSVLNKVNSISGTVTLTGSGMYNYGSYNITTGSFAPGFTLDANNWTGTVALTGGDRSLSLNNLSDASTRNSKLKLTGFKGYLSGMATSMTNNLVLENGNIRDDAGYGYGILLDNGTTTENPNVTFSGSVEGDGHIIYGWKNTKKESDKKYTATHIFSGDTSEWNGMFIRDLRFTETTGNTYGKNVIVKFTAGGDVFKENGNGGVMDGEESGQLNVVIDAAGADDVKPDTNFHGVITDVGSVEVKSNTVFNRDVTTGSATVDSDVTAKVNSTLTAGTVSNAGQIKLGEDATVTGGSMSKVQMSSTGITGTAQDGSSSIDNADVSIAQLAADTRFSITDMALSNVKLTATNAVGPDEEIIPVVLRNVTAENTMLTGGEFTLYATPTPEVGSYDAETRTGTLSYSNGLGVSDGGFLMLNLDVINAVAPDKHGMYDIIITLTGFGNTLEGLSEGDIMELVGFDPNSWLAETLDWTGQDIEVASLEAEEDEDGDLDVPTVTYSPGTGENVGTLVITISGLNVPEPASATLGLAALMMLCARRRRKA